MPKLMLFFSDDTIETLNAPYEGTGIEETARDNGIELELWRAIIQQESSCRVMSMRREKQLKNQDWYTKILSPEEMKNPYAFFSMGLAQILFGVAKSIGYTGTPEGLLAARESLRWGAKHFAGLLKRYGNKYDAVSAYNQGNRGFIDLDHDGVKDPGEPYRNQDYVDAVFRYYAKFKNQ